MSSFRTIQGCAVFSDVAPYIAIVVNDAHAEVLSIYRGEDAAAILHKHGKSTQAELFKSMGGVGVNPPGRSTHELRGDGAAYGAPVGSRLQWWQQGFDINDVNNASESVINAAKRYGWRLYRPYSSGIEHHHLNFLVQPKRPTPGTPLWARLWRLRFGLPRS